MHIVADFCAMRTYEEYETAMIPLKNVDVAMLFLNAGIGEAGAFADVSAIRLQRIL